MTLLAWFPYDAADWRERMRALSLEEEGALHRVCREAWTDPVPCTIADTPAALENLLGTKARKLRPLIRAHFAAVPELPGRLRCAWLHTLYLEQLAKYEKRVTAGSSGGRAKADRSSNASSNADGNARKKPASNARSNAASNANGNAGSKATAEGRGAFHQAPPGPGVKSPPPEQRRAALKGAPPPGDSESASTPLSGESGPMADTVAVQLWAAEHPEEYAAAEAKADQAIAGWPNDANTQRWRDRTLNSELIAAYRRTNQETAA